MSYATPSFTQTSLIYTAENGGKIWFPSNFLSMRDLGWAEVAYKNLVLTTSTELLPSISDN